jgi:hypothetical protein
MADQNKSVGWTVSTLALLVAYFGWGFLAADYFQNDPTQGPGETSFWWNSVAQLPNLPAVLSHGFHQRFWLVALIVLLEVGVLVLWGVLKKMERELWGK